MNEVKKGLNGYWTCFNSDNSPLPADALVVGLAAGKQGSVWIDVYVTQPSDPVSRPYALFLTDGVNWSQYRRGEQGLSDGLIENMTVDSHNRLWFSVRDMGICCFNGQSTTTYGFGQFGLPEEDWVTDLHIDASDCVWSAAFLHGIYRLSNDTWSGVIDCQTEDFGDNPVRFGVDRDDRLWIAYWGSQGTDFLSHQSNDWRIACSLPNESRHFDMIDCFTVDKSKRVWVGTEHCGLLVWDGKLWHRLSAQDCPLLSWDIETLMIDEFDNLWVGTPSGFAVFDEAKWYNWEAIYPGSTQRPISEQELHDLDSEFGSQHIHIGGQMVRDGLGRKWISAERGIALFSPQ